MALFGFNKQKVLAAAEKYVQQGKLQSAVSEYEKILKHDAKDLTVMNTVGDLYSRIGESDKATQCFRQVGDAYASQGFTVKAIAMYKKICKLQPSLESLLKLAELYTQQGLFNDARAQYLQVAEEFLKAGELENAVRIFQKILEMDPENSQMRVKLAEVYVRLGKKQEAWQIFTAAAETLRSKGSLQAADEVLQRMLTLDPANTHALLMQGKTLLESGDAAGAVATLSKVPDIDSKPEGLRDLLKAYLLTGQLSDAGTVANKLLTVHNDLLAISSFADALMQAGQYENALQVYDQHAERLLAENSDKVLESLRTIIGHVRDNPDSLQKLLDLFNKAGDNSHVSEVMELLAHASVQAGDLGRAKDLYEKLATLEPQNTLHMQNYQQVVGQLGGASGSKLITPEEAVVLIDDLEATAPAIHQHYSDEVAMAIRSALTDAELFISYNMPAKALGPLVGALPMAPNDLRLNQRLAALHTRAGRFAEAAICCRTLQRVYSEAENPEEATRYAELAERYEERSSAAGRVTHEEEQHIFLDAPAPKAQAAAAAAAADAAVPEFTIEDSPAEFAVEEPASAGHATVDEPAPWPTAAAESAEEITVEADSATVEEEAPVAASESEAAEAEIDLSSEWDDAITVEADEPAPVEAEPEVATAAGAHQAAAADPADEVIEEIRFYLGHGMPEQAMAALARLQTVTGDQAKLAEIRAEVEAATAAAAEEQAAAAEPAVEEVAVSEEPAMEVEVEEAPVAEFAEEPEVEAPEPEPVVAEEPVVTEAAVEHAPKPVAQPKPAQPKPAPAAEPEPAPAHGVLKDFVSDLESSLGSDFVPGAVAKPLAPAVSKPVPAAPSVPQAPAAAATSAPVSGKFVADIESSKEVDFRKAAPAAKPPAPSAKAQPAPVAAPIAAPKVAAPMAASAAASASPVSPVAPPVPPAPVASVSAPAAAWPTQPPAPPKPAAPIVPPAPVPAGAKASSPFGEEAGVDLAEMFGELKQDLEADVASADEDPETHYNLGIAFREMGLLDEAIGELQKACQALDRGHAFPQIMQAYTWLAQCFLEKGVPEAAVRWYEKALSMQSIDGETRVALNYELAAAYETAGDKASALKYFMNVYGSNIDYRDVAERIKALKS